MNQQAQVQVFEPPNMQPRGRRPDQPARVEVFAAEHGPEIEQLPDGSEVTAPETDADPPPRKRTSRKASP